MTTPLTGASAPRGKRKHPWVLWALLVAMIAIPVIETWLIIKIGHSIGVPFTILLLVATAALGAWLMKREGSKAWKALADAFSSGKMPTGQLADAALVLVGGTLLMVPGFFTDIIGLVFLLPFTRPFARRLVGYAVARTVARKGVDVNAWRVMNARLQPDTVIEGETVEPDQPQRRPDEPGTIRGEIVP